MGKCNYRCVPHSSTTHQLTGLAVLSKCRLKHSLLLGVQRQLQQHGSVLALEATQEELPQALHRRAGSSQHFKAQGHSAVVEQDLNRVFERRARAKRVAMRAPIGQRRGLQAWQGREALKEMGGGTFCKMTTYLLHADGKTQSRAVLAELPRAKPSIVAYRAGKKRKEQT